MNKGCKNCSHFNFKVSGTNGNFGECLNPKNEQAMKISMAKCDITHKDREEVNEYGYILLNEDVMSCSNFESREKTEKKAPGVIESLYPYSYKRNFSLIDVFCYKEKYFSISNVNDEVANCITEHLNIAHRHGMILGDKLKD